MSITRIYTAKHYYGLGSELPEQLQVGDTYYATDTKNKYTYDKNGSPSLTSGSSGANNPRLNLPAQIYATQDVELNIYFDSIVFPCDKGLSSPADYRIEAICDIGKSDEKRFYITPTSGDVGQKNIIFNVYSLSGVLLETKSVGLNVTDTIVVGAGLNMVYIGDSITASGMFTQNFRSNLPTNTPTFWGTQGAGPDNHEGNSGWSTASYLNLGSSPFFNGSSLDIANYRSNLGLTSTFDIVSFMLGVNDCFTSELDNAGITAIVDNMKELVDAFIADSLNTQIYLQLPTIDSNTSDGWAHNYQAEKSKIEYQKNIWNLREMMVTEFDLGAYNSNVFLGYAGMTVDRYYGYPMTTQDVSSRISTQIERHTNAVHPQREGYDQLGDGMFSMIASKIDQDSYGPELFLDTDFSEPEATATGWQIENSQVGVTIDTVSQKLKFDESSATASSNMRIYATNGTDFNVLDDNTDYKLEYTISDQSAGTPDIFLRAYYNNSNNTIPGGVGTHTHLFTTGSDMNGIFQFVLTSYVTDGHLYISDASLKKVLL